MIGWVAFDIAKAACDVFIAKPIDGGGATGVNVICEVPRICWACVGCNACDVLVSDVILCWAAAIAICCCPCDVFAAAIASGVALFAAIIWVCGVAMLTIGVAWTWTGAIETPPITCGAVCDCGCDVVCVTVTGFTTVEHCWLLRRSCAIRYSFEARNSAIFISLASTRRRSIDCSSSKRRMTCIISKRSLSSRNRLKVLSTIESTVSRGGRLIAWNSSHWWNTGGGILSTGRDRQDYSEKGIILGTHRLSDTFADDRSNYAYHIC